MTTIYTEDGQTVTRRYRDAPVWHWVDDGSGHRGEWVPADTATGYFPLVEVDRPADTETTTHDYAVVRTGETFVETWTQRDKTDDEIADDREAEAPNPVDVLTAQAVAAANANPQPWKQPEGAHDAYLPGAIVTDGVGGDEYRNTLTVPNVWPLSFGWENLSAVGPQPWQQPVGAGDAYPLGAQVTHNGQTWENTGSDANVWEPGVFGWVVV